MSDIDPRQVALVLLSLVSRKKLHYLDPSELRNLRQNNTQSTTVVLNDASLDTNDASLDTNNTLLSTKEKEAVVSLLELNSCYQEVNLDDKYMEAIIKQLGIAENTGEINPNSSKRLRILQCLINKCQLDGLVTCMISSTENNICILGWSQLLVKEPLQFNIKIHEMIKQDYDGIWKKANGNKKLLKNPTRIVYELFRKIGVKPRSRGPVDDDPGKHDMLYYKEWNFINDESFKIAHKRLATGFSYCPYKSKTAPKKICTAQITNILP